MAVATIGAASLAPVFQFLCDQVNQSMQKDAKFKTILGFLQSTLVSFRARIIEPVQEGRHVMYKQNERIEAVVVELQNGAKLVAKLRSWRSLCLEGYAAKLLDLDRKLRDLLEWTWIEEIGVVRRQNSEVNRLQEAFFDSYKKVLDAVTVKLVTAAEAEEVKEGRKCTSEEVEEESKCTNEEGEAALFVFRRLFEAVSEAGEKNRRRWMFRFLISDIQSTMYSLQPFLEEMAASNRMLARPKEELRSLVVEMMEGMSVVRRSHEVAKKWEGYSKRKDECIGGLLGLNQCLQRYVYVLRSQTSKNASRALDNARQMEQAVNEIVSSVGLLAPAGVSGIT
ncbi:uncharacterized protein LOC126783141 [Argentina anserina]|uniref:uncharacterized protein LOC126783141 n=1 Tax=Argentina anserina TaxID=57926 RepID=UPI0021768813|nr:uncharacterized protein LOC126783141 [Potentilla anserina]XP_050364507.1 uncharacterized protein LOC126783141 [Potentilla anserina]